MRHPWVVEGDRRVRFGVQLIVPDDHGALPRLMQTAQRVEALGYDAAFIFDHPACAADPFVSLAGMSTVTSRLRLGSAVICAGYRHPAMLARLGSDVDNLSQGRFILGLGSGWLESEFGALGLPWRPLPERQRQLDEVIEMALGCWGDAPYSHQGEFASIEGMRITPKPVQAPRPPIMIGGSGERVTLSTVARLADACNIQEAIPANDKTATIADRAANVANKLAALDGHMAAAGRPLDEVLRTHFTLNLRLSATQADADRRLAAEDPAHSTSPGTRRAGREGILATTSGRAISYYTALRDVGIRYFVVQLPADDAETIERLATEVMPAIQAD